LKFEETSVIYAEIRKTTASRVSPYRRPGMGGLKASEGRRWHPFQGRGRWWHSSPGGYI